MKGCRYSMFENIQYMNYELLMSALNALSFAAFTKRLKLYTEGLTP